MLQRTRLFKRFPSDVKFRNGDTVAFWHAEDGKYVRARVEDPYKEMCSGNIKGYIFMVSDDGSDVRKIVSVEYTQDINF